MNKQNSRLAITFEWHSLLRDIVRNFWAILLVGVIAWMGIHVAERTVYTPEYTSSATLVVRSKVGTSGAYTALSVSNEMATIFTDVFRQSSMKQLAAEHLGRAGFSGSVSSGVIGNTNMMVLSVTCGDPELAFLQLEAILDIYPQISESVFANAVIDVLSYPEMPTGPSNSISTMQRGQIMLIAMVLEGAAIVLLSLLRDTAKDEISFLRKVDSTLVGTVTHEKSHRTRKEALHRVKRARLISNGYSSLKFTEDYQRIAGKLEYARKHQDAKVFSLTSVAENEGKSTAAVNIALALAGRGYRVALLDLDIKKPSVHKILDCRLPEKTDLSDVLSGKADWEDFPFIRYRSSELLLALNKPSSADADQWLTGSEAKKSLASLRRQMDFVIIDSPPLFASADAANLAAMADRAILVVRTDRVAAADLNDAILTVGNSGGKLMGCILNDLYRPFTLFGQMGLDESGYYSYRKGREYGYSNHQDMFSSGKSHHEQELDTHE